MTKLAEIFKHPGLPRLSATQRPDSIVCVSAADGLRQNAVFPVHQPATGLETKSAEDSPLVSVEGHQQADPGRKGCHV